MKARLFRVYVAIRCACSRNYKADYEHRMTTLANALASERVKLKAMENEAARERELLDTGPVSVRMVQAAKANPNLLDEVAEKRWVREQADKIEVEEVTGDELAELMMRFGDTAAEHERQEVFVQCDNMVDRRETPRDKNARKWSEEERAVFKALVKKAGLTTDDFTDDAWSRLVRLD